MFQFEEILYFCLSQNLCAPQCFSGCSLLTATATRIFGMEMFCDATYITLLFLNGDTW
jgi:hypothetical protein